MPHVIFRSLSQEKSTVQGVIRAYIVVFLTGATDVIAYAWFGYPPITLSRALVCLLPIYGHPGTWLAIGNTTLRACMSTQTAGWELLVCGIVLFLIRCSKTRIIATYFAYGVLFFASYITIELVLGIIEGAPSTCFHAIQHIGVVLGLYYAAFLIHAVQHGNVQ